MKTIWIIFLTSLLLSACASPQEVEKLSDEEMYRRASVAVQKRDYEDAEKLIDRLRDEHPFSDLVASAELLSADIKYANGDYEEAAAAYASFEDLHPTHPKVPYAVYKRGQSYLNVSLSPDRDQTAVVKANEAFQKLVYAFPETEYANKAKELLEDVHTRLAKHELYVARFYIRKKKFDAALGRLNFLTDKYPQTPQADEAFELVREVNAKIKSMEATKN